MRNSIWFLLLLFAEGVWAIPVEAIRAKYSSPVTPRGGVLMVPLLAETTSNNWPSTLGVILDDGTVIEGHIGWIENYKTCFSLLDREPNHYSSHQARRRHCKNSPKRQHDGAGSSCSITKQRVRIHKNR